MTKNDDTRPLTAGGFSPVSGDSAEALKPSGFQPLDPGKRPERTPVWPKIIVGVIGLTVAGLLFFLLTARSLEVQVEAIGSATIDIDGINVPTR